MLFPNRQASQSWKPRALVIDNDADLHRSIHVMLGKDYDVHHAYFPRLALSLLEKRRFNVVLTSLDMGEGEEMPELQRTICSVSRNKGIPIVGLSGICGAPTTTGGATDKRVADERLLDALRTALVSSAPEATK